MTTSTLHSDEERILAVLNMLDDESAERALRSLDPKYAEKLRGLLADFSRNPPSLKKQKRILEDFESYFRFAMKYSGPRLKLHNPRDERPEVDDYAASGNAMEDLEQMNIFQVTSALEEELPRTAAILMKGLSAERISGILSLMQSTIRDAVVRELSTDPKVPAVLVEQMAKTTVERALTLPTERAEEADPIQRIADALRVTDKSKQREILQTLQQQDPQVSASIQKLLYRFEDLKTLEDHKVRAVLSKVDTGTLSIALYGGSDAVLAKVKMNLSKRARLTLEEEISFLRNVSELEVKQAHITIVEAIAEVEMEAN